MSKDTGTPVSVARWARTIGLGEGSTFELHALDATGSQLVTTWSASEAMTDLERWSNVVSELVSEDAQGRGQSTRYELRHRKDDRTQGVTHLRRIIVVGEDGSTLDGSQLGLVAQLQRALHQSHAQLLDASRAAIQAQQASMVLLGQAYNHIATLQAAGVEQHQRALEQRVEEAKPDMVKSMLEVVGPHIATELAQRLLAPPTPK